MTLSFSKLQQRHKLLLELEENEADINAEVLSYIKQAKKESTNYSLEERDNLRANLRYWASYIFEKTDEYPDTTLPPVSKSNNAKSFIQNTSILLATFITLATLIVGTFQIVRTVISLSSSTAPSTGNSLLSQLIQAILIVSNIAILTISVILWRRGGRTVQRVKNVAENIRKTIVGGGRRGRPLASLHIVAGPLDLLHQNLNIYTERINLGRDPQQADLAFYSPSSKTSISGLHARIERMNGAWQIVAVSGSQSETFVENKAIPFHQPYPIYDGQIIRLGYPAQQPVEFEFQTDLSQENNIPHKTDVEHDTVPLGTFEDIGSTDLSDVYDDDIFDEFR